MKEIRPYLIILSAVVSVLCFPPFRFGPFIFLSLVPLLLAVEDLPPYRAFKYGFLWGIIFYLGLVYYIAWVTPPGMIATVLILALIPGSALLIFSRLIVRNRGTAVIFLPLYFIMWNWLLTMSDLNYPWTDIGYALAYYLPFIQAAEIGGVYLVSLIILAVNVALYASVSRKFVLSAAARGSLRSGAVLIIALLYVYGVVRLPGNPEKPEGGDLKVGILQGNMTRDIKWKPANLEKNFETYFDLSEKAAAEGAEFLVWPETATPTYLVQERRYMARVDSLVDSLGVSLLTGTPYYEVAGPQEYIYFNSAVLIKPGHYDHQVYSKIHLVPMSEKIPFSERFKKLKEIRLGQADFSSGREMTIFDLDGYKFATVICFESAFPGYCRRFAQLGAQFLVVITNDMWFGRTSLLEQHAMMSVFRAVENRIPVVRSANTGISMAVDKWGRILVKSDIFVREHLIAEISPENSKSIYGRYGDIIPEAVTILVVLSLFVAFLAKRRYFDNGEV
jgi:apolipoprotein N-acyltransferase